ncbi:dCTP deaminase [Candidatus Uhrbacteria bacterium]|jgi:deoxycytidine triphosphate deaminase|nr:dCTP deaminase [Candidatus Uhrbacteria bacterium]MBT7717538.1 dCTP deaminase [Candidatus Uhrbacteria bacterium]
MILTRKAILERIKSNDIVFDPGLDHFQLQPHAIDLRLGYKFLIPKNWTITEKGRAALKVSIEDTDIHSEQFDEVTLKPGQYFDLLPNEFVIATSLERIEMNAPDLMAILFPRTSTNRRGINLSLSGIIDTGYNGNLIFPMKNEAGNQVLRIFPGERICQVIFEELSEPLTSEEAQMHGLSEAKYSNSGEPKYKVDKSEERDLLTRGNLQALKDKFSL